MASISIQHVTKVFDRCVTAVSDLMLEVPDGQFMVLVGPSGCGKTTTLRLTAGLERPDSGQIRIGDQIVNNVPPIDRDVAMVFQDGALYPHMDVYGNLAFALKMAQHAQAEIDRRVTAVAEMLGLGDVLTRKPATLSGGQRRRVALGRAIVRKPAVFLFDEPLTNLDVGLRLAMRAELKALHQRLGTTTLYVTHDQAEAMALGEKIAVLCCGQIQQVGSPSDIYDRPANRFVAGFFGTPPMNLLAGRVLRLNGDSVGLKVAGERVRMPDRLQSRLAGYVGQKVHLGVRPHDVSLTSAPREEGRILFSGTVAALEPLGSQTDVHVALPSGQRCIVAAGTDASVCVGDDVRLEPDPDKLHLFENGPHGRNIITTAPE